MMFYIVKTENKKELCGGTNQTITRNLKTLQGVKNRLSRFYEPWDHFNIYTFTNVYNEKTYTLVYSK